MTIAASLPSLVENYPELRLGGTVTCKCDSSDNKSTLNGEVAIHFPGLQGLDKNVFVFPKLVVCLHCGLTEFTIPENELRLLAQDAPAA